MSLSLSLKVDTMGLQSFVVGLALTTYSGVLAASTLVHSFLGYVKLVFVVHVGGVGGGGGTRHTCEICACLHVGGARGATSSTGYTMKILATHVKSVPVYMLVVLVVPLPVPVAL
jgi:hypothetical protein